MSRTPATERFGSELKAAREAAGLSREEFGKLVGYAPTTVGAFETGVRFPQPSLVKGADEHLGTGDKFSAMYQILLVNGDVDKEGFRPWTDDEREASSIWTFELVLIPGLLQTEAYARALWAATRPRSPRGSPGRRSSPATTRRRPRWWR